MPPPFQTESNTVIEPYPTLPEPPLSLPIRMAKKKKQRKLGTVALVAGIGLLAFGGYNFTIRGSELIAGWLSLMALGALVLGIAQLRKASVSR